MAERSWLREQIELAESDVRSRPEWFRRVAHFAGCDERDYRKSGARDEFPESERNTSLGNAKLGSPSASSGDAD